MVKRVSLRPYFFVAFAIMVMMFCWESNRIQAAVLDSTIPKDSIRIRILANSDNPQDQWIKRQVQLEVVKEISGWVMDPQDLDEARTQIQANIPKLGQLVGEVLVANGYANDYQVELGQVPFPAKQYGSKTYPAGNYEALRIVLGSGQGQNWWCVLFPPLCFVGVKASAEKPANEQKAQTGQQAAGKASKDGAAVQKQQETVKPATPSVGNAKAAVASAGEQEAAPKTEVKFFLWEVAKKGVMVIKGLFA